MAWAEVATAKARAAKAINLSVVIVNLLEAEASGGWDARCASALPGGNTGTKQTTSSARRGPYRLRPLV